MALKWLRDNLRHLKFVLWGVVFVFVLLVFVDWGAGGAGGGGAGSSALRIGDRSVSEVEFLEPDAADRPAVLQYLRRPLE